jgi:hypothetical protein
MFHNLNFSFCSVTYSKATTILTAITYRFNIKSLCILTAQLINLLNIILIMNSHFSGKQKLYVIDIEYFL